MAQYPPTHPREFPALGVTLNVYEGVRRRRDSGHAERRSVPPVERGPAGGGRRAVVGPVPGLQRDDLLHTEDRDAFAGGAVSSLSCPRALGERDRRLEGEPMSRLRAVVAVLAVFTAGAAFAQDVTVTPDVVYGHKYGMALTFDVFTPADANGAAVLNMVSGGWRSVWRPHAGVATAVSGAARRRIHGVRGPARQQPEVSSCPRSSPTCAARCATSGSMPGGWASIRTASASGAGAPADTCR